MCNRAILALLVVMGYSMSATGAEVPAGDGAPAGEMTGADGVQTSLPPEAEAAHQDLIPDRRRQHRLDEAVFTEIWPVTVPEIGIALPPDQEP
jgi:hypothetical protein